MEKRLQNSFYKARMNPIPKQKQYKKENYTWVSLRNIDVKISNKCKQTEFSKIWKEFKSMTKWGLFQVGKAGLTFKNQSI